MSNWIGLFTLIRREFKRTMMTINQVIWPPVIITLLFLFIFGVSLGSRIKSLGGVPYVDFLLPGLVMMNVIASSYEESASSLFQQRFMASIQEILIAPLSYMEFLVGFLAGSVLRGLVIGNLVMLIGLFAARTVPHDWPLYLFFSVVTAVLFSAVGIIAGLLAKTFDNLAVVTTFFITPLTYVGGVFSSIHLLPPLLRQIALFNPMLYMIDGLRFSYTRSADVSVAIDATVATALALLALFIAYSMTKRGVNLRV